MAGRRALPPQFDPAAVEPELYRKWREAGVFAPDPAGGAPYVIVIPPPNVTDRLHMGHGLNNTLQDVLIRFERMRGRETLWMPGTDHAGIATQNVIERQLAREGTTRQAVGRDAFVARVWTYVRETGDTILRQLEALGASCDWSRTRFTLDEAYSDAVRRVFVALYKEKLIYRGHRVIHWCPRCGTALSDEEAEFREEDGTLYQIRYRIREPGPGSGEPFLTVATTRPETIFADVAVVFHPDDARYQALRDREVEIPLSGLPIPVRTSPMVEREFGTGLLKVTPAHDANDFEIANALWDAPDRPVVITAEATLADVARVPAAFRGLERFEARRRVVAALQDAGLLAGTTPHRHAVRHCYRCDTVVEPRLSDQWFVRMRPLAAPALAAWRSGALRFVPERWGAVYEHWLSEIRDWNISRQLWWGHRIPAWYCAACDHITVAEATPDACAACGGAVRQDDDVLDTWFSSWLWPFATLGWPARTDDLARYYPGHTLVTGPDIIFFWVARMVMAGYHFMDAPPFATVYLNGIVRDTLHQKMSKSRGNGIDPLVVVRDFGADALRYTMVAGAGLGTDVILDPKDLETSFGPGRNFANKLWNVGRFILSHLDGPLPPAAALDASRFELADRWILARTQRAVAEATAALERFRLNEAAGVLYHFVWDELADWYVEQVKPRLHGDAAGGAIARAILADVLRAALTLLHPVMPFVTEALWAHLPGTDGLLAAARWPAPDDTLADAEAEDRFARVQALIVAIRQIRAEYQVPPGTVVRAMVQPATLEAAEAINAEERTIERLARVRPLAVGAAPDEVGASAVLPDGTAVFVPLGDAIDVARERARLAGELARLDQQLTAQGARLANAQFTSRAPADVVARERAKEQAWREQRAAVAHKLRALR